MEKKYEEFLKELCQELVETGKVEEKNLSFVKKGEKYARTGDRLFVVCDTHENTKEICGLYTEELYQRYRKGAEIKNIAEAIMKEIGTAKRAGLFEQTKKLSSYEESRDSLFIRLINAEENQLDLEQAVYRVVGDIAMVLYMKLGERDGCLISMKMRKDYIEKWGIGSEDIFREAMLNTYRLAPPRIFAWENLLYDDDYRGEAFVGKADFPLEKEGRGNCLSTSLRTNGAIAIFYPGVAGFLADLIGGDLYLVFTSMHEVMVHNARNLQCEELADALAHSLVCATPEEDYLTASIYQYSRLEGTFSCVYKRSLKNLKERHNLANATYPI